MKLNKIFSDGAVIPFEKPFKIYGESDGETIVSFHGTKRAAYPKKGVFSAEFPPMPCGGPFTIEVSCGEEKAVSRNVYIGKVYLIAGQSNVMFKTKECLDDWSDAADDKLLRSFFADHILFYDGDIDRFRASDGWIPCRRDCIPDWTALSFFIGRELRKKSDAAVGMINGYEGASVIQSWLPETAFENGRFDLKREEMHPDHFDYDIWNARSMLYRKTFGQIKPYAVNGVIWYQGESNTTVKESEIYADELKFLADSWRKDLGDENMPFILVQIADFDGRKDDGWRGIQKAQKKAAEIIRGAKLVVSKDVCSSAGIHPPEKKELAKRIAQILE